MTNEVELKGHRRGGGGGKRSGEGKGRGEESVSSPRQVAASFSAPFWPQFGPQFARKVAPFRPPHLALFN